MTATGQQERQQIARRAGVVAAGTLASRMLGLVRDQVMAAMFSLAVTDAFTIAFLLPNVLRQLLAEGAVQSAVLPVLSATREREGDAATKRFFAAVRGLSLCLLTLVTVLGIVFAPLLVDLFAPGFREQPGQFERTLSFTRGVFPYLFFMGTAALGVAALNSYHRFAAAAFAPLLLNVAFVALALAMPAWLVQRGYDPGLALVCAALVGGVLQVLAQWPSLAKIGFLTRPSLEFGHPGVREVLRRMGPVLIGTGVYYVDTLLARRFLSELGEGAPSYFNWALRLCDFPQGIFVMALQSAALPSLARLAAKQDGDELSRTFSFGLRLALFVAVPATALCMVLAEPLVVLLFQRGAFDANSAHETGRALVAQAAGIWLVAAVRQLVAVYYAFGDTRTPVVVASLDLLAFIAAALLLRGPFGHVGVSLAVSCASAVQAGLLWWWLKRHLKQRRTAEILSSFARIVVAAAIAAAAAWAVARLFSALQLRAVIGSAVFALSYFAAALLLRCRELEVVSARLRRRA